MSTIHSPFWSRLISSNFSSVLIVFPWLFTWIELGNVDLRFSLMLIIKANAVEGGTISAAWLYHQHNKFINETDGITVKSLSASFKHKTRAAACWTENYCILSMPNCVKPKIIAWIKKKGINIQVALKRNRWKRNHVKRDLPVYTFTHSLSLSLPLTHTHTHIHILYMNPSINQFWLAQNMTHMRIIMEIIYPINRSVSVFLLSATDQTSF
jgi:hypothetical protein